MDKELDTPFTDQKQLACTEIEIPPHVVLVYIDQNTIYFLQIDAKSQKITFSKQHVSTKCGHDAAGAFLSGMEKIVSHTGYG